MRQNWQVLRAGEGLRLMAAAGALVAIASVIADEPAAKSGVAANVEPKAIAEAEVKPPPGVVASEFIYETAAYPECHASTIAETPSGLVAAWFGGTKERHPDVGIWFSRRDGTKWSTPVELANGV